jgi:hypothetical protein
VALIKLDEDRHLLVYDMSHIISDGASMNILIQEFAKAYNGETLPELPIQYKDYPAWQHRKMEIGGHGAAWQQQMYDSEIVQKQEAYWLSAFADQIPLLNLPNDYPRPAI